MSNGEGTGSVKKEHHVTRAKRKEAELDALLSEAGVGSVEELRAKLAAPMEVVVEPTTTTSGSDMETVVVDATAVVSDDPLAWIDGEVDTVHLISRNRDMPGWTQRRHRGLKVNEDVAGRLGNTGYGHWKHNPFRYVGTHKQVTEMRYNTRDFARFTIERNWAEYVYSFEKNPMPEKVVVGRDDYRGQNQTTMQPDGKRSPASGDPLREYVRYLLQTHPGRLWINKDYHFDEAGVVEEHPNPYSDAFVIMGKVVLGGEDRATDHVIGDVVLKDGR